MVKIVQSRFGPYLLLILISLATVFFRLGSLPFVGGDEPRYARIASEMENEGRWVTPVLEGYPWLEKPPLYYWITIPFYAFLGEGETAARLGPALCALIAGFFVFWAGARIWSRRAGLLAGAVLLTSIGFSVFGRAASTDMPMTACYTIAMAILAVSVLDGGFGRWKARSAYIFLALAVLAKGPVAVVLAAGTALLFWAADERGGSLRRFRPLSGAAITAAVALPWFWLAWRENGFSFISIFLINHNLARYVSDIHHHDQPFFYYVPVLAGLMFPWTGWLLLLLPGRWREAIRRRRDWDRRELFLAAWFLFPLLFFSLSQSKLAGYILPSLAPLALLLGARLDRRMDAADGGMKRSFLFYFVLSSMTAIAIPPVFHKNYNLEWTRGILLGAAVFLPALAAYLLARREAWSAVLKTTVLAGAILVLAVTQFAYPALAVRLSAHDIALEAVKADEPGEPIVSYRYFHHTLHYYTGYRIASDIADRQELLEFADSHPHFLAVTEASRIPELEKEGFILQQLGEQGRLRLLRLSLRPAAKY